MNKYDISQKIEFKTGTYELNSDANFNFQLNRVIMWDGGDADEVATVSQSIKTSADEEYDMLQNARSLTLRLLTDKQNAGAHCNVGNSKLVLDSIIKWVECCTE